MSDHETGLEIAVIGMSGRFPGADTLEQFWSNLMNGRDSFSHFNKEELRENGVSEEEQKDSDYIKVKPFLEHIYDFDAELFGYTAWEADYMDPQNRLFHECVYHALEDSGYNAEQFKGRIGLYAGASMDMQWMKCLLMSQKKLNNNILETSVVSSKDFISQLISYKLNLTGPSISLYTGCSTSLVAIHLACSGLLLGDINMAVAGGVSIMTPNKAGYQYSEGSIYSKDGRLRPYDEQASGTVFGDGAGAVVLKRLSYAIEDQDHIYAVIRSTACNNDGSRKVGFTAPSLEGQKEVIQTAYEMGETDPLSVQMLEGHGTGTNVGDPIEVEALKQAFDTDQKEYCALGSVKANIGHLHSGAGIASFIKAILALKNKVVPPACQFDVPNQKIKVKETPFFINKEPVKLVRKNGPLRAGVSSFGVGGTNVHIILQEAPKEEKKPKMKQEAFINLSAKTEQALKEMSENMIRYLEQHEGINLMDVAFTLSTGRKQYKYNKCCIAKDAADAIRLLSGEIQVNASSFVRKPKQASIGFLFSGQRSVDQRAGRKLYEEEPYFQGEMDRLSEKMMPALGVDIRKILCGQEETNDRMIIETRIMQSVSFAFEYALARYFIHIGIKPDVLMGHSLGEYTAAAVSGVFSEDDAIKILIEIGKLLQSKHDRMAELFDGVLWNEAQIPIYSCTTGKGTELQQFQNPSYWIKQPELPGGLSDRMLDSLPAKDRQYIDLGIQPMFHDLLMKNGERKVNVWSPNKYRGVSETENNSLLICLFSLIKGGVTIDWTAFYEGKECCRVPLPLYPFQRKCYKPDFLKYINASMEVSKSQAVDAYSVLEKAENAYVFVRPETEEDTFVAPETETDKIICEVVSKVLSIDRVGIRDDFFWLGAHSLLITKIISRLNDIFRTEIPLDQVMEEATVEAIHRRMINSWGDEESLDQVALAYREYQLIVNE